MRCGFGLPLSRLRHSVQTVFSLSCAGSDHLAAIGAVGPFRQTITAAPIANNQPLACAAAIVRCAAFLRAFAMRAWAHLPPWDNPRPASIWVNHRHADVPITLPSHTITDGWLPQPQTNSIRVPIGMPLSKFRLVFAYMQPQHLRNTLRNGSHGRTRYVTSSGFGAGSVLGWPTNVLLIFHGRSVTICPS